MGKLENIIAGTALAAFVGGVWWAYPKGDEGTVPLPGSTEQPRVETQQETAPLAPLPETKQVEQPKAPVEPKQFSVAETRVWQSLQPEMQQKWHNVTVQDPDPLKLFNFYQVLPTKQKSELLEDLIPFFRSKAEPIEESAEYSLLIRKIYDGGIPQNIRGRLTETLEAYMDAFLKSEKEDAPEYAHLLLRNIYEQGSTPETMAVLVHNRPMTNMLITKTRQYWELKTQNVLQDMAEELVERKKKIEQLKVEFNRTDINAAERERINKEMLDHQTFVFNADWHKKSRTRKYTEKLTQIDNWLYGKKR